MTFMVLVVPEEHGRTRVEPHPAAPHNAWASNRPRNSRIPQSVGHCCVGRKWDTTSAAQETGWTVKPDHSGYSGPDESPIRRLATSRRVARHLNATVPMAGGWEPIHLAGTTTNPTPRGVRHWFGWRFGSEVVVGNACATGRLLPTRGIAVTGRA